VPYTITVDTAHRVIRVHLSGVFDATEAPRLTTDARAAAAAQGFHKILYDVRAATAGRLENSDLFWLPRTVPALKDPSAARVRVATMFVEAQRPIIEFWETAFRNMGLTARGFQSEEAALDWLAT